VFTPDLPGEYSRPFHDNQAGHSGQLSKRSVNSPELGIALIGDNSEDRKLKARYILGFPYHFADTALLLSVLFALPWRYWKPHLSPAFSASRGPPRMLPFRMRTMSHFPLFLFSSTLYRESFCSSTRDINTGISGPLFSTANSINHRFFTSGGGLCRRLL